MMSESEEEDRVEFDVALNNARQSNDRRVKAQLETLKKWTRTYRNAKKTRDTFTKYISPLDSAVEFHVHVHFHVHVMLMSCTCATWRPVRFMLHRCARSAPARHVDAWLLVDSAQLSSLSSCTRSSSSSYSRDIAAATSANDCTLTISNVTSANIARGLRANL